MTDTIDRLAPVLASAGIGHNSGAAPDPFVAHLMSINDAYDDAKLWLDGEKVQTQEQADALGKLYTMLDEAQKAADEQRVILKRPHDQAAAAVQAQWKPLVDKADKARKGVKLAVQRWNDHLAEIQRIEAERVREEARKLAAEAQAAHEAAIRANNLEALEQAEQQLGNADTLADMARRAEQAKAVTKTGGARGIGKVPTRWVGRLADEPTAAQQLARHYWQTKNAEVVELYLALALKDIAVGARTIPGMIIAQEKAL